MAVAVFGFACSLVCTVAFNLSVFCKGILLLLAVGKQLLLQTSDGSDAGENMIQLFRLKNN